MCGISGILHFNERPVDLSVLQRINRTLAHRGPDDEGYHICGPAGLAQRRLSIIDLSGGHQPMVSSDGRYTLTFNGEIYNFLELKKELEEAGVCFQTHSDTEVLLWAFIREGVGCLSKLNGMFAFAVWDAHEKTLVLARDRMGKKPLYYWLTPSHLVFASELKAIKAHPDFSGTLDLNAARHFFQYEYVPAPLSIFKGVSKLPQAHYMVVARGRASMHRYWEIPLTQPKIQDDEPVIQKNLITLLDEATQRRLMSDVPLGVFLSGGIDSSAIVALMSRHRAGSQIKTFSIGFEEASYDESDYAALIARRFGTEHHQAVLSASKMLEILPTVTQVLDEPYADYSILPTYLLSRFTRQSVTVALGGDGGDELFAGYPTFAANDYAEMFQRLPRFIQTAIGKIVGRLPVSLKDMSLDFKAKQFIYGASFPRDVRNQVWLGAFHRQEMQKLFLEPDQGIAPLNLVTQALAGHQFESLGDLVSYFYQKFYLCDDILVKTDRASMANSLEVRAPFLDVNVVEYAARIPFSLKLKKGQTKYILKKALEPLLPHEIIYRPKKGFGIPLALWLRGELKGTMLETLSPERIRKDGLFNNDFIQQLVQNHLSGRRNNRKQLFTLLMFHWWMDQWLD